jgi:translin
VEPPDTGAIAETVTAELDAVFAAREIAIASSRRAIRSCANSIRALHRDDTAAAAELVAEAERQLGEALTASADHPELRSAGFVHDAAKEYAEANITAALLAGRPLPTPQDLGVDAAPYLNGLGEAIGELRRRLLDRLRRDEVDEAEGLFVVMEELQGLLETIDYPDAMTGGLRRTTDVSRSLVERSRADLTATVVQERLRRQLES